MVLKKSSNKLWYITMALKIFGGENQIIAHKKNPWFFPGLFHKEHHMFLLRFFEINGIDGSFDFNFSKNR
jgi:hypothetical protein